MSQLSFHHMDMNNQLFYYLKRKKYINYSFGLNHKFLLQGGFSNQFISLILHGNYQYLDQEISLSNNNIKAYNIATRSSEDLESGVGKWLYTYVSNEIKDLRNSSCIYSISYFKSSFLAISKCNISETAYLQLQSIRDD